MPAATARKRGRRIMDPDEREAFKAQRRQEERERLAAAVAELASSEGWARWVDSRKRFHNYSLGNTILIALQRPDATQVASYRTWQSHGRQVRKGEHGIRIMAPMAVRVRKGECEAPKMGTLSSGNTIAQQVAANRRELGEGTSDDHETRMLFKSVSVFDISQTDGDELPELASEPIDGDSLASYLPALEAFGAELGYSVERELIDGGAQGYCAYTAKRIVTDERLCPNARVRCLVHELAHAIGAASSEYGREDAEVIADTAALIVCSALGFDTSGETVPYVAGWSHGDPEAIHRHAAVVDEIASKLERAAGLK
jgi:hypothetical protein